MSDQDVIDRAKRAEKLLNDQTFKEAFGHVEKALHDAWANAPVRDKEGAHEIKLMLKLLRDVKASIEQSVVSGKATIHRLEEKRRWFERGKRNG